VTKFLQTLMDGVAVGSLYALIALGYTMVYGILQFINFAHSDVFVLGAWISYTLAVAMGYAADNAHSSALAGLLILLAAMATCGAVGFTIERLAYRPLRNAPRLNVLITAIGVSLLLQNVGQLPWFFGTQPQRMPEPDRGQDPRRRLGRVDPRGGRHRRRDPRSCSC
jgi:branched-chain amino acid transport system permease protein